jgi:hypothetical protein
MMTASKFAWAIAAALLVATAVPTVSVAGNHGGGGAGSIARQAYCQEYKQRAEATGEEYWWSRWRQCMRGWN